MAKCRCNICKAARGDLPVAAKPTERFHTEQREYRVKGGSVTDSGRDEIERLLIDFTHARADVGLTLEMFDSYCKNKAAYSSFLRGDRDSYCVLDAMLSYMSACDTSTNVGSVCPSGYSRGGRSREEREKNAALCIRQWFRWYSDRLTPIKYLGNFNQILKSLGKEWITKTGKYTTRLAAKLAEEGCKLTKGQLETIGNTLTNHVIKEGTYTFSFDQDFVNGSAEDYCHADSCWWGGFANARPLLAKNGGQGLRMWKDGKAIARCWIAPHAGGYLLFNAYGKMDLAAFANVFAECWSMRTGRCDIHGIEEKMYVNNDEGIHLHPEEPADDADLTYWNFVQGTTYTRPELACTVCAEATTEGTVCDYCQRTQGLWELQATPAGTAEDADYYSSDEESPAPTLPWSVLYGWANQTRLEGVAQ